MPFPNIAQGGGGGGSSYDDTALAARVTALEASMLWNLNSAAAGTSAGPSASVLISNLSATKRSLVRFVWTQSGAALASPGMEFEPNDVAGDGDSNIVRFTNTVATTESTSVATVVNVNHLGSYNELVMDIDPVNKVLYARHHGIVLGTAGRLHIATCVWNEAAITSFRLTQGSASATMSSMAWTVWTAT
jgi:hypothetical protein